MKILHLLDEPWDSGITSYALQTSELLQNAGHSVVLGVMPGKKPESLAKAKGLRTASIGSIRALWALFHGEAWDVVNVHTGRSHTWVILFNIITGRRRPIVRSRGDARLLSVNALSRFVYRRTAGVIAASEHIGKQYEEDLHFEESRTHTIYPSVTVVPSPASSSTHVVGILGRLDPVKGHSTLLEAAATVLKEAPQTTFLVAGREAGVSVSILKNQARSLEVEKSVQFLGFQDSAIDFMKKCSVGVIASIGSEEISRACLEWMSTGRPVVGTLVGSLPELIEPGETGFLVAPGDSAAMGKAILALLKDGALRDEFGRHAQQIAERKFGPEIQLSRTLELYQRAIQWMNGSRGG